eukprot:m51a1_g942 hypothetical protein (272) ;mRNA; r:257696-258871
MFKTLADLRKDEQDAAPDGKKQRYYTGGESSGLQVEVPPDGPASALPDPVSRALSPSSHRQQKAVAGAVPLRVTFYADGFAVAGLGLDGALRSYTSPAGSAFVAAINERRLPDDVTAAAGDRAVDFELVDRRSARAPPEAAAGPAAPQQRFAGSGFTLGSSAPSAAPAAAPAAVPAHAAAQSSGAPAAAAAAGGPGGQIQVRMADGTRAVGKFAGSQTVGDLYAWVASRSALADFELVSAVPPVAPLADRAALLGASGLLGSVVVQRPARR